MYSSDFTCITDARNKRVVEYHPVNTRAATMTQKDEPNTVIIAKPINTNGITCQVSMNRLIKVSTHPPKYPAMPPRVTPTNTEIVVTTIATVNDKRIPKVTRVKMSRPKSSVPNQCPLVPGPTKISGPKSSYFQPLINGPMIPARTNATRITRPTIEILLPKKRLRTSCQ